MDDSFAGFSLGVMLTVITINVACWISGINDLSRCKKVGYTSINSTIIECSIKTKEEK